MKSTSKSIGDEQEHPDFEWDNNRSEKIGHAMGAYSEWVIKNQPHPSQDRKTFSI